MKCSLTDEKRLVKGGCVGKLAKQAQSYRADHQNGAIRSLVALNVQGNKTSYIPLRVLMFSLYSSPNNSA